MINGPRTFHDRLVAQPRPTDLALAPDGTRLILSVAGPRRPGSRYFPDESHGVEAPNHLGLLYETVLAFLDHHVLGEEWRRPELL
ncbi:hypothetical protein [Streptomyces shaanxiensis]